MRQVILATGWSHESRLNSFGGPRKLSRKEVNKARILKCINISVRLDKKVKSINKMSS